MELKEIVSLYRRWIWLVIAGLVLGMGLGFLVGLIQTPVYEASAKVLVAKNRQQGSDDILSLSDQQLVATYQHLLKTQPVLDQAGSQLGVKINANNVRADVLLNTQIIQITVADTNAVQAAAIANTLVKVLIDQNETLQAGRYGAYEEGLNLQVAQVQKQIADLQAEITQLTQANVEEQLTQINKQIASLQDSISGLQKDIAEAAAPLSTVTRADLAEKQAQLTQLRSMLSLYQQIQTNLTYIGKPVEAGSTPNDPQVVSLQSTLNLYQQLYLNLLNNLEAVKLARFQSTPTVSQIDKAVPPTWPVRPLPVLYMAMAGLVGLLLAAAAVLLIDYFAGTFTSPQQVRNLLHAPVVGQIADTGPRRGWFPRPRHPIDNRAQEENAFGSLRVNLDRLMKDRPQKTMLVTSPWQGEGKTTVSANLAKAFAQAGKRVILVDTDLYHPQVHARFGLENQIGLADILSAGVDWQEASCTADNITIITSGRGMSAQGGLLGSDKMNDLLERLQRKADIVILDGAPLFLVNTQILASRVGGMLLVIQQGTTRTSITRSMKEQLDLMGLTLLGVVLNRVPRAESYYDEDYFAEPHVQKLKEEEKEIETA